MSDHKIIAGLRQAIAVSRGDKSGGVADVKDSWDVTGRITNVEVKGGTVSRVEVRCRKCGHLAFRKGLSRVVYVADHHCVRAS